MIDGACATHCGDVKCIKYQPKIERKCPFVRTRRRSENGHPQMRF